MASHAFEVEHSLEEDTGPEVASFTSGDEVGSLVAALAFLDDILASGSKLHVVHPSERSFLAFRHSSFLEPLVGPYEVASSVLDFVDWHTFESSCCRPTYQLEFPLVVLLPLVVLPFEDIPMMELQLLAFPLVAFLVLQLECR